MPELPDVEAFCRRVAAVVLHRTIRHMKVNASEMVKGLSAATLRSQLEGHSVKMVERYGKHLLLKIEENRWLDLHFGMSGFPQFVERDTPVPRYTRMALEFDHGTLAYVVPRKLGRIALVGGPDELIRDHHLGPDALDPQVNFSRFADLLHGKGNIKCWLMDQSQLAGIGNVYSDEILYHARLDPRRRASELSHAEVRKLYESMHRVLKTALAREADPAQLPADWLLPHRRAGQPCPGCAGQIERVGLCGRSAYLCPSCQH